MISCIVYETDKQISGDDDAWASPKFFLDIKKGDSEDHAILLTNLLLGLSIDAYVCVGRACVKTVDDITDVVTVGPSSETHTWVMARRGDGSVSFYECGTGKEYILEKRWQGTEDAAEEEESASDDEEDGQVENAGDDTTAFSAFYEDDVSLAQNRLHARDFWRDEMRDHAKAMDYDSDNSSEGDPDLGLPTPHMNPPYWSIQTIFNHENVWANLQSMHPCKIMYEVDEATQWKPFCSFEDGFSLEAVELLPFYKPPSIPARLKKQRAEKMRDTVFLSQKSS